MRTGELELQMSLFAPGSSSGKTSPARSPVESRKARTSESSSRKYAALRNQPLMFLDQRPGAGNLLGLYWEYDPPWLGAPSTRNTGVYPKDVEESSLWLILEASPPIKYYLSPKACLGILRRATERGKPLPIQLETALWIQAGLTFSCPDGLPISQTAFHINQRDETIDLGDVAGAIMATQNMQMQTFVSHPTAFAANQRDEVRDLHDVAGALGTQPGMKQQTFIAESCLNPWDTQQARVFTIEGKAPTLAGADGGGGRNPAGLLLTAGFCAGASPAAGSIGYQEEVSPTLRGSPSGNMMPSVLCINDQGGRVMDCSEDLSGTLRAQEHGHQPLVFENHGIDARYNGPFDVAPTMSARYGTGGNNVPLVTYEDSPSVFSRQRVDVFQANDIVSTESARQHKDATDLVIQKTVGALTRCDCKGANNQFISQDKYVIPHPYLIRRLTPLECERLQGFPDGWTYLAGASDSARYKALGNSVAIPCVEFIMRNIALCFGGS